MVGEETDKNTISNLHKNSSSSNGHTSSDQAAPAQVRRSSEVAHDIFVSCKHATAHLSFKGCHGPSRICPSLQVHVQVTSAATKYHYMTQAAADSALAVTSAILGAPFPSGCGCAQTSASLDGCFWIQILSEQSGNDARSPRTRENFPAELQY